MKKQLLLFILLTYYVSSYAQTVIIPDSNFKNALLNHTPIIDTNSDGEIQVAEAENYTQYIEVPNKSISDLTGIEAFNNIKELYCGGNNMSILDISNNSSLEELWCNDNGLTELIVNGNSSIKDIYCHDNNLESIDLSDVPSLSLLVISHNNLTSLNITQTSSLVSLYCDNNNISSFNTSTNNMTLKILDISHNNLSELSLSYFPYLKELYCSYNQIESLDVSNMFMYFDTFYCNNNDLTYLNLKLNSDIYLYIFSATNNPNLTCIYVYNAEQSSNLWEDYIDANSTFVETISECESLSLDEISTSNFEVCPNPFNTSLYVNNPSNDEISNIFICISVFCHNPVIPAITSLSKILSPKYRLFSL